MTPSVKDRTDRRLDWSVAPHEALSQFIPLVYNELRLLASRYLRRERPHHSFQPADLVHETYLRMAAQKDFRWQNRVHFFSIAAEVMRRILIEHARRDQTAKRGGRKSLLPLDAIVGRPQQRAVELVALDHALNSLATIDAQQSRIVELRFFTGLTIEETAIVLHISPATVKREWNLAKTWLHHQIDAEAQRIS